jgi:hypothetical protein
MSEEFENFNDEDEEWLTELEIRATDLENELFDWREAHARDLAETSYGRDGAPRKTREPTNGALRAHPRQAPPKQVPLREAQPEEDLEHVIEDDDPEQDDELTTIIRSGARPGWPEARRQAPRTEERTQALIDRGRRSASRARRPRSRKVLLIVAALAVVIIASVFIFRTSPSWPSSVATVQGQITAACQNPNVASEPGQVNFACGQTTRQILWVFALMTSGDNPHFTDAKTGRQGLEPIMPTQGGDVAWSLNLHQPYDPSNAVDSIEVAARAINNIIGGATLTSASGTPSVQAGLESSAANCQRYTGSSALRTRSGYPAACAGQVTSASGQAALVSDVFRDWMVGAPAQLASDAGVLFVNSSNPGNPQVQQILNSLPGSGL